MARKADPPWWWKPWLTPYFAFREWRERPRKVRVCRRERREADAEIREWAEAALPLAAEVWPEYDADEPGDECDGGRVYG